MAVVSKFLFLQIFIEYVVKNPLCSLREPIQSELFKSKLDAYVKQSSVYTKLV